MPAGMCPTVVDRNDSERSVLQFQASPGHIVEVFFRLFIDEVAELDVDEQIWNAMRIGNRNRGVAMNEIVWIGNSKAGHDPRPCCSAANRDTRIRPGCRAYRIGAEKQMPSRRRLASRRLDQEEAMVHPTGQGAIAGRFIPHSRNLPPSRQGDAAAPFDELEIGETTLADRSVVNRPESPLASDGQCRAGDGVGRRRLGGKSSQRRGVRIFQQSGQEG